MKNFTLGIILGSLLSTGIVTAGQFYDSKGQPAAPKGSIQQFDYFRQRQQYLDLGAMRRNQENHLANPCAR